jgi:hypothetical protein
MINEEIPINVDERYFTNRNFLDDYEEIEQKKQKEIFVEDNDDEAYFNRIGLK